MSRGTLMISAYSINMSVNRDYEEVISEIQHYQEEWCNGEKLGAVDAL